MADKDKDKDKDKGKSKDKGKARKADSKKTTPDETLKKSKYKLAEDLPPDARTTGEAPVIDLDAARQEKEEEGGSFLDSTFGSALRDAFRAYVLEYVVPDGQKSGTVNVNLDRDFVKEHGGKIISSVVRSVTQSVIPEKLQMAIPTKKSEAVEGDDSESTDDAPAAAKEGADADGPEVNVAVNFDVVSVVKDLFSSLGSVVASKRGSSEDEPDDDTDEDEQD